MKKIFLFILFSGILCANAQLRNDDVYKETAMDQSRVRNNIRIPDIKGYNTLKCDFHIHTIFSDGKVWPDVRIDEAWQQGLDAIAITDHIEYRPHKDIVSGDLNESYKIAKRHADNIGFIVIKGTEITRSKPLGHLNALFVSDVMPMDVEDPLVSIDIALKQGAFIMWNHPGWPDDKSTMYPVHEQLIKDKKIHGVEVFNYLEYYPVSFNWCKNMNLSFMANSDIHETVTSLYNTGLRPITLVFAKERSEKGIKDALFAGRSAAYFNGKLAGKKEHLLALIDASVDMKVINEKNNLVELTNNSDIGYEFVCEGKLYILPAGKTVRLNLPKDKTVTVNNCFTGMNEHLEFTLKYY